MGRDWHSIVKLLDRLPWIWVVVISAWLAIAPIAPEPHLVEKLRMLASGSLRQALDIFDLLFHLAPLCVLLAKVVRWRYLRRFASAE